MFFFPFSTLHELNLDWILNKVKTLWEQADENNQKADYAVETADEAKTIAEQAAQAQIADGAVTTVKIADGAVTNAKLAANAVESANIKDGEVKNSDIADGAVTTAKITNSSVTRTKIMDGEVTYTKLNNDAKNTRNLGEFTTPDGLEIRFGIFSAASVAAGATADVSVTYNTPLSIPAGSSASVVATPLTNVPGIAVISLGNVSATGFDAHIKNEHPSALTLAAAYIAIAPR